MLTIRKRRGGIYHVRGTVRVGGTTRIVNEASTGLDRREDAEAYRAKLETQIRGELLDGPGRRTAHVTIAKAVAVYLKARPDLASYDLWRLDEVIKVIGERPVDKVQKAWAAFVDVRCQGLKAHTIERFRGPLQKALTVAGKVEDFVAPRIERFETLPKAEATFLTKAEARRLLGAYDPGVRPMAIFLAHQGARVGEARRVEWRHIDWNANTIFITKSKTGLQRTVTMHEETRKTLHALFVERGSPRDGHVFLNRFGRPYADPNVRSDGTEIALPGGSPIKKAHATACRGAGIEGFTTHDWRHHWASWAAMSGVHPEALREEGGWQSIKSVQVYARLSTSHRAAEMRKLNVANSGH
jgi:integrase